MAENQSITTPDIPLEGRITSMPSYYRPKRRKSGGNQNLLIFGGIGLVIVIILIVIIALMLSQPAPSPTPAPELPAVQPTTPSPAEVQEDEEIEPEEEESEQDLIETVGVEDDSEQIELPQIGEGATQQDVDADQDGLTDTEEELFGTNAALPDTDEDGFLDGAELLNLYDPAAPTALLETSEQIRIAQNSRYSYQFLIPEAWSTLMISPTGEEMLIRPTSGSERMTIQVYTNPDRLSVTDWFKSVQPTASLNNFINFTNEAGWTGIQTADKRTVFATFDSDGPGARAFIFVMHYDTGNEQILRYQSTWNMIVNSLSVLVPLEPEDLSQQP